MTIPNIIWQTHEWKYEDLPHHFKRVSLNWKNLNKKYLYQYHDKNERLNVIKKFDKALIAYVKKAGPIIESDIWRLIVIYENGGFYADMDSICTMPLDYFLKKYYSGQSIITRGGIDNLENSNFGSNKKNNIIRSIIEEIRNKYYNIDLNKNIDYKKELWTGEIVDNKLMNSNIMFSNIILKNKESICFNLKKSTFHYGSQGKFNNYKIKFDENFIVDYFGEKVVYSELCKKNGWEF